MTREGKPLLISIQNEREWRALCDEVFEDREFARDLSDDDALIT